jgi:DNA repair exonuclease SbcCD ATPase subunit
MKRNIVTSDWELQPDRLGIAEVILKDLFSYFRPGDRLVFVGDLWRSYSGLVETFAKKIIGANAKDAWFIVGNHDRELEGTNRLSAAFDQSEVFDAPTTFKRDGVWYGILPAPDRSAFGATRQAEGRRARDVALSDALEAALIALETMIGRDNLSRAVLFAHGAASGEDIGTGQLASGLTWTIPGERLSRWGKVFLGHCHNPRQISENIWSVGGIANWTFSDRAEQFRALVVDTETLEVSEIPLLRVLVPIELTYEQPTTTTAIANQLMSECAVKQGDTLNLKLHFKLPPEQLALLPTNEAIEAAIADAAPVNIHNLIVCREPVGLSKVRLETADARSLSLSELFSEYLRVNDKSYSLEVAYEIEKDLLWLKEFYKPGKATFGFKPLTLEVIDFRQWCKAVIDFSTIRGGATVITGPNESGKTNLLEAIPFAFDKHTPSSPDTLAGEIRRGANSSCIEFTFEAPDGLIYKVSRVVTHGKGKADCKTEFLRATGNEAKPWEPVCGENERSTEIDKRISEMVGSQELRSWLMFRSQRDLDALIKADPSEWHGIMQKTFNLSSYAPLHKAASDKAKEFADSITGLEAKIDELEAQIAGDAKALKDMPAPEALANRIEASNKLLVLEDEKLTALRADREAWVTKRAALQKLALDKTELERHLKAIQDSLAQPIEDIGARPQVPPIEIGSLETAATDLKKGRDALLEEDVAKQGELAKARGQATALEEIIENCQAEIMNLEADIRAHEQSKSKLESPPCNITTEFLRATGLDDYGDRIPSMKHKCPAWLYYSKADRGAELQKKLEVARERKSLRGAELRSANDKATQALKACEASKATLSEIAPKVRELETQIGDYRNAVHATELWEEKAKGQLARIEEETRICDEIENLQVKLKSIVADLAGLDETKQRIFAADSTIGELNAEMERLRGVMNEAGAAMLRRADLEAALAVKQQRQIERRATIAGNNVKREAWEILKGFTHPTGAPYLLMEKNVGYVQRIANELLSKSGSDLRVRIESITPTQKGEARDKISVYFTDSRGENQLRQASGEQSVVLSMALGPALSIAGSEFCGATPYLYTQDEGWDRLDLEHRETLRALIGEIAARFGWFLFIAHLDWLISSADHELRVILKEGRSELLQ